MIFKNGKFLLIIVFFAYYEVTNSSLSCVQVINNLSQLPSFHPSYILKN